MRFTRCLVAVVATGTLTIGGPAAHATVCNLVTDPVGDTPIPTTADIVSADIASDSTWVTAVIRLVDIDDRGVRRTSASLLVDIGGVPFEFDGLHDVGGDSYVVHYYGAGGPSLVSATGFTDLTNDEIHISARVSDLAPYVTITNGTTVFDALAAQSTLSMRAVALVTDTATSTSTYTAGDASCVTPGS